MEWVSVRGPGGVAAAMVACLSMFLCAASAHATGASENDTRADGGLVILVGGGFGFRAAMPDGTGQVDLDATFGTMLTPDTTLELSGRFGVAPGRAAAGLGVRGRLFLGESVFVSTSVWYRRWTSLPDLAFSLEETECFKSRYVSAGLGLGFVFHWGKAAFALELGGIDVSLVETHRRGRYENEPRPGQFGSMFVRVLNLQIGGFGR